MIRQLVKSGRVAFLVVATGALLVACERPPMSSEQRGYRGLAIQQVHNKRTAEALVEANVVPESLPAVQPEGPLVTTVYKNVQVLGDLTVPEFARVMAAMTTWVAPDKGCAYCHAVTDMSSDELYTKKVARRMLQMTRHLNTDWKQHVAATGPTGATGVTCYTCHRGQAVPARLWYETPDRSGAAGAAGGDAGQNSPVIAVGLTSLPYDPFTRFLDQPGPAIKVQSLKALPEAGNHGRSIKAAEATYGLMMYISGALGVNCTYCHNSRAFESWEQSAPQRVTAWYGIRMVRDLNTEYLESLKDVFPATRLGPLGDVPKVDCATCHQGAPKPLLGANMYKDYPELGAPHTAPPPPAPEAAAAR